VIAGAKTIDLGWDRNTDADLAGYRIYRAVGDGPFVRIPGEIEPPSFRDTQVQTGQRYRYVITAVDKLGNESGRSEPAEAEAP
jgi:fibronectin type 3 domain-containing protein